MEHILCLSSQTYVFEKGEDYYVTMQFEMQVAIFLIQRNRHALIGRAIDDNDMDRVLQFLKNDPV